MARTAVLGPDRRPVGYVEDADGLGRLRILDDRLRVVGYVDTKRDVTMDAQYRVVARGSVPGLLLR